MSLPLLVHACELVRIRMMVARSQHTRLAGAALSLTVKLVNPSHFVPPIRPRYHTF